MIGLDWQNIDPAGFLSPEFRNKIDLAMDQRVSEALLTSLSEMGRINREQLPAGPDTHTWVYFDYLDGKLGMRVEPKNPMLANAMKDLIPKEERLYIGNRRTWVFQPIYAKAVMQALALYCQGYPLMVEAENQGVIMQLLFGPVNVAINRSAQPGVHLGNIGDR